MGKKSNPKLKGLKPNPRAIMEREKSAGFKEALKQKTQKNITKTKVKSPFLSNKKTKKLKHRYA